MSNSNHFQGAIPKHIEDSIRVLENNKVAPLEDGIFAKTWFRVIGIYLVVQAIIGFIAIEFAWHRTKRFREQNEDRDARFPSFRRYDAKNWSRWKFYPGAMLAMPTRIILLIIDGVFLSVIVSLLAIGHDFRKGPIKNGCRKWMMYFMYHVCCSFYLFVCGMSTTLNYKDVDYSHYLGPDYKTNMKKIKRTSTIVSNHVSWLDPVVLIKNVRPAFAPSEEFRNVPLLGTLANVIDSIYIPRGGNAQSKAKALMAIRDRQELIEQTGQYAPFLIFPEGGTTNGTCIITMKQGAFFAEKTVRPLFMKYKQNLVSPAFDIMEFLPLAILQLSWACFKCDVWVLPDFQPNEYLFETHRDKGTERWQVFAWAIRDIICREGDFQKCNLTLRKKFEIESYMQMKPGSKDPCQIVSDPESLLDSQQKEPLDNSNNQNISSRKNMSDEEMLPDELNRPDSAAKQSVQEMVNINKSDCDTRSSAGASLIDKS